MQVPFIDLKRVSSRLNKDVMADWQQILDKTMFVGGPFVETIDRELAEYLDNTPVLTCSNGSDALLVALQAMGIKPGMKVGVPNITFWATVEAVVLLGATPVLIDIDADDLQLSLDELKSAHERHRLDMVVTAHLFGWASAHLAQLRSFCVSEKIVLLEDAAQAFGVKIGSESVVANASASTLSFYPAKVLGSCGDAGAIVSRDQELLDKCRSLVNHGRSSHYSYGLIGWNARMGGLQAAFLSRALAIYQQIERTRQKALNTYREVFATNERLRMYLPPHDQTGNAYLAVFTCEGISGEQMVGELAARGVGAARTYPEPMHVQPALENYLQVSDLARSSRFCQQVFNLPMFAFIEDREVDFVCEQLQDILRK